ncbi:MAG: hypothetical protein JOZ83_08575 [Silvibacterium sp.]|nr:hypothetical protein [Silvibacterium sp.]
MRTTLSIDDDILAAAKEIASRQHKTVGEVISALSRQALRSSVTERKYRNGIPLLPVQPNAKPATLELVNRLRDELP